MLLRGRFSYTCARCREDILPGQAYLFVEGNGPNGWIRVHHTPDCDHAISVLASEEDLWSGFQRGYTIQMGGSRKQFDWSRGLAEGYAPRHVMIWSSEQRARRVYSCDHCPRRSPKYDFLDFIYEGDTYIREVWVGDIGWKVIRRHVDCPLDPWDGPEEDSDWDSETDFEEESQEEKMDISLEKAA